MPPTNRGSRGKNNTYTVWVILAVNDRIYFAIQLDKDLVEFAALTGFFSIETAAEAQGYRSLYTHLLYQTVKQRK